MSASRATLVYPRIWQLARLARPKLTRYAMPDVREHDKPYFYGPDDVTSPVGYFAAEQWVEFTAFPPENGHVLPRDIYDFRKWLRQKKMDDGQPLKEIRVTFHQLAVAEREKRPLLDVGCRVFGYDNNGNLVEVTQ